MIEFMMFPTSLNEFFRMSMQTPVLGAAAPWKYAAGGALAGGAAAVAFLGAKGISQGQTGQISGSPTTYSFPTAKEVTLNYPTGASVKQGQDATQQQPDYLQWILLGGIAIAGLYVLSKKNRR